ncbi:MAG: exosortase/archaeosortase family protein [Alphaproteobacteria bacterium]|nr:exosortase/archaeosortase family protein [Alphaproteobacteria bacterium]
MPSRRSLYLIAMVLAALNAAVKPVLLWLLSDGIAPNFLVLMCVAIGLMFWYGNIERTRTTVQDGVILIGATAFCMLPFAITSWLALAILACASTWRKRSRARHATAILIASALRLPVASGLMALFAGPLLTLDGWVAGLIAGFFGQAVSVDGNLIRSAAGHSVFVMSGCASLANVTDAMLIWMVFCLATGRTGAREILGGALGLAILLFASNVTRLGMMAISAENYRFLHDGLGASVFQTSQVIVVGIAIAAAVVLNKEPRRAL